MSLSNWADDAAEKLKRAQLARKAMEDENNGLRAQLSSVVASCEKLQTKVAQLEEEADGIFSTSKSTPLRSRITELEDLLQESRDSLKRKRDRERTLIKASESLETKNAQLTRENMLLKSENSELSENLALAMQGITLSDGLMATVARSWSDGALELQRREVVTVVAVEGSVARVVKAGQNGSIPIAHLACVGIPLLQYIELVMPDRSTRERLLEDWLRQAGVLGRDLGEEGKLAALQRQKRANARAADGAANDSVAEIRKTVASLLNEIDESFSEASSPMSRSTLVTPRGGAGPALGAGLIEALMSSVTELSASANQYNSGFSKLNDQAAPLMRAVSVEEMDRKAALERQIASLDASNKQLGQQLKTAEAKRDKLVALTESLQQERNALASQLASSSMAMADVESLQMAELSLSSANSATNGPQQEMADQLQMQIDLNDAVAERERLSVELDSLQIEVQRLRGMDVSLSRERERCVLLEKKIVELSGLEERAAELSKLVDAANRKASDLEQASANANASLQRERERSAQLAEQVAALTLTANLSAGGDGPVRKQSQSTGLFSKLRSGSTKKSSAPPSVQDANAVALASARAELETVERKLAKSPRAGGAKSSDLVAERDRLVAEVHALEALAKRAPASQQQQASPPPIVVAIPTSPVASSHPVTSELDERDAAGISSLAAFSGRSSVRGSLNDSMIGDSAELNAILAEVQLSPDETAERFRNDGTREEELVRRSYVLKNIPGVRVMDKAAPSPASPSSVAASPLPVPVVVLSDSSDAKLNALEKKNADLTAQLEVEKKSKSLEVSALEQLLERERQQEAAKLAQLSAMLEEERRKILALEAERLSVSEAASRSVESAASTLESKIAEMNAQVELDKKALESLTEVKAKLESDLFEVKQALAAAEQRERELHRDEEEASRRLQFDLNAARVALTEEKETRARIEQREEASKQSLRAELAKAKHEREEEIAKLTASVAEMDKRIVEATKVIGDLTDANATLKKQLSESEASVAALEARVVQATSIIEQLASKAKENQKKAPSPETLAEMERLRGESATRDARLAEAAKVIDELTSANKALTESSKQLQVQQDTMQQRLVDATMVISELREANAALEKAASQTGALEKMEQRLVEATVVISQLRGDQEAAARREAELGEKNESLARSIKALEARLAEATGIIENLFAANKKLEDASREGESLEGRLVEAAKTISQLRDQNKEVASETDELRMRYNKLAVTLRDLTTRYNAAMAELKVATAKEAQQKEVLEVMRKELVRQAQRYDELERSRGTPQRATPAKEDVQMAEQMQQLARMIKSEPPTTPVRGVRNDGSDQARALAQLAQAVETAAPANSNNASAAEKDLTRRMAALDVRESRVEARETLLAKLTEVREALKKAEAAASAAERKERETALQLETVQKQLASRDKEKAALVARCREQDENFEKLEQENEERSSSLNRQLGLLQTERAELRRLLDSKLQPDANSLAAAEIKLALAAEALKQAEDSHAQNVKYLNEELASQRRLRETYEEVNAAVKGWGGKLSLLLLFC